MPAVKQPRDKGRGCFRTLPGRGQSPSLLASLEFLCTQALHLKPIKFLYCFLLPFQIDFFMPAPLKAIWAKKKKKTSNSKDW